MPFRGGPFPNSTRLLREVFPTGHAGQRNHRSLRNPSHVRLRLLRFAKPCVVRRRRRAQQHRLAAWRKPDVSGKRKRRSSDRVESRCFSSCFHQGFDFRIERWSANSCRTRSKATHSGQVTPLFNSTSEHCAIRSWATECGSVRWGICRC